MSQVSCGKADDQSRQSRNNRHKFYDEIIASIREANSIQILSPGEAKGELEKRIELEGLSGTYPCHRNHRQDNRSSDFGKSSGTFLASRRDRECKPQPFQ